MLEYKVMGIVKNITRGKVMSYQEVAKAAGQQRAYRAVGNILNKNYNQKIPCHRVVKSDSSVGGFNRGVGEKLNLLKKEGVALTLIKKKDGEK